MAPLKIEIKADLSVLIYMSNFSQEFSEVSIARASKLPP